MTTVLLATFALCATAVAVNVTPAGAGSWHTIARSHPAWATDSAKVGAARRSDHLRLRVYLALRDAAGAEAAVRAVSDPTSSLYRHYLTTAQVRARFAPSAATVASVRAWLSSVGLRPGYVPSNNQFAEATGTVASVQKAFSVGLGIYQVQGQEVRGTDRDLSVPAQFASTITGVVGADQGLALVHPDHIGPDTTRRSTRTNHRAKTATVKPSTAPPPDGFRNARPCSAYWTQKIDTTDPAYGGYGKNLPYAVCGYTPQQLRQAYGVEGYVNSKLDGRNVRVAIIDAFASPTIFQDASTYARRNDPAHPLKHSQFNQVLAPVNHDLEGPDQCDASGWYGEESLDVEAVHGMAPGAHIPYVGGSDCNDVSLDKALNLVVSKHLAQIVSNSYGDLGEDVPAAAVRGFHNIAIEAALEGIGLYFSSGDDGDEAAKLKGVPSPDFSATDPLVTAVGGTSLAVGPSGERVLETGWETGKSTLSKKVWTPPAPGTFLYGSGGGSSRLYAQPYYQRGVVPDRLAKKNHPKGGRGRVVPDISMDGDPNTGMLIGLTQTFPSGVRYDEYRIGGTSLSSPLLAGLVALADDLTGHPHGFINPSLYRLAGSSSIRDVLHVKAAQVRVDYVNSVNPAGGLTRSVRTFDDQSLTIHTNPGYDDVTGLGVPRGIAFLLRI
ncbi:MAG: S53 family peptidase [Actinomycetota bacterium]|nr:S53 family peptidase [Actinomycetota bacterium]